MRSPKKITPLLVAGLATISLDTFASDTTSSPFEIQLLNSGYHVAAAEEGKCGEGKCGKDKKQKKSDKEAVCGIYQIGSTHDDDSKVKDGKCGGHKVVESLCGEG